ncbi:hypothetical protein GQ600_8369 [Phytophthora cactorum]|nr:hypothetical protein GQ600_8369 [Phytophthora cactorum]
MGAVLVIIRSSGVGSPLPEQALDDVSACGVIGNGTGNGILVILHNVAWFAHDAERSDAVGVILAARRSSQIASALFRSKSLAIGVFKRRSLLLCDLLRTSDGLNNGSTVSCSRRRTQMEEGALNLFSIMVEFRKFIVDRNPCADVVATGKVNIAFPTGAVYWTRHVGYVGSYDDIAKGAIQFEAGDIDKIGAIGPQSRNKGSL